MERDHTPVETSQYHFVTHMQVNTTGTGKNACSRPAFSPGFEIGVFCAVIGCVIFVVLQDRKTLFLRDEGNKQLKTN